MLGSRHALIAKNLKFRNSLWIVKRQLVWSVCHLLVPIPPRGTRRYWRLYYYSSRARVVLFYWSHLKHGSNTEKWLIFTSGLTKLLPYSWIHERLFVTICWSQFSKRKQPNKRRFKNFFLVILPEITRPYLIWNCNVELIKNISLLNSSLIYIG